MVFGLESELLDCRGRRMSLLGRTFPVWKCTGLPNLVVNEHVHVTLSRLKGLTVNRALAGDWPKGIKRKRPMHGLDASASRGRELQLWIT